MQGSKNGDNPPKNPWASGNDRRDGNIISLKTLRKRGGNRPPPQRPYPPMFNLPPLTKALVVCLIVIQLGMTALPEPNEYDVLHTFGFISGYYSGALPFRWTAFLGPFTYFFFHAGWTHVLVNILSLMAFGAGLEKAMGWRKLSLYMLACSLAAIFVQFVCTMQSTEPVIGASGAISGMFAGAIVMMYDSMPRGSLRQGPMPFIAIFLGMTVLFGLMGGPGGEVIAWPAHIGGFLAGYALFRPLMRWRM